jgi:ribosomal protein L40E
MKDLLSRIPLRRRRGGAVRTDGSTTPVAGVDPAAAAAPLNPSFRDRGRLRRRLRYLRRVRELGFRDLGGLVFDQHRFNRPNEELVRGKLAALHAVDAELRALETLLDDPRPIHELREPGVSACIRCGALHGSDARFCPSCGVQVRGPRAVGEVSGAAAQAASAAATTPVPPVPPAPALQPAAEAPPAEPAPPAGPAPAGEPAPAEQPTEVVRPADGS